MSSKANQSARDLQSAEENLRRIADESQVELAPISPEDAVEMYLTDRERELRESSLGTYRSALGFFLEWCDEEEVENLNDLSGRDLHQYRIWRRNEAPSKTETLSKATEETQQGVLKRFIRYCESIDAVPPRLHEKVRLPSLTDEELTCSDTVDAERARAIIGWREKYEYGSLEHVTLALLAETGARIGGIVGLDLDDYRPNADPPHLRVRHRPKSGTELKNGENGERLLAIGRDTCSVVDDYLQAHRPDVTDDHGRQPLLATSHGRVAKGTVRRYVYRWTRPCAIGEECPHGRDVDTCEAATPNSASKCPSSNSPHAIRRGYISHELSSGVDRSFISGRCNVSEEVLKKHYDARDEYEKMEVRRRELANARRDHGSYGGD